MIPELGKVYKTKYGIGECTKIYGAIHRCIINICTEESKDKKSYNDFICHFDELQERINSTAEIPQLQTANQYE